MTCNENARRTNYVTLEALAKSATSPPHLHLLSLTLSPRTSTTTTHQHNQQTTLHSSTTTPSWNRHRGTDPTSDKTTNPPGETRKRIFYVRPNRKPQVFRYVITRLTRGHLRLCAAACALAGQHAKLLPSSHTVVLALHVGREVMWWQERGNSALRMGLCSKRKNNKLTQHSRPVRRSG